MKKSKKYILTSITLLAIVLMTTINAEAQKKVEFGIRYMPNISSFDMKTSSGGTVSGTATLGHGVGAFLGFNFTDNFGIQGEIIYNSFSQKYKDMDVVQQVNLKYVNIPLLLSLNTGKSKIVNLNIVAGPQIGISVGSSINTSGNNGTYSSNASLSIKKSDFGFAYGGGLDFGINPSRTLRLGLGYRGVVGLVDISNNSQTTSTDSYYIVEKTHLKSNSGYIGLSIMF